MVPHCYNDSTSHCHLLERETSSKLRNETAMPVVMGRGSCGGKVHEKERETLAAAGFLGCCGT